MSLHILLMMSLVVMGIYLLFVEYLISKQKKEIRYLKRTLHHLLITLDNQGIITIKEVGEDE